MFPFLGVNITSAQSTNRVMVRAPGMARKGPAWPVSGAPSDYALLPASDDKLLPGTAECDHRPHEGQVASLGLQQGDGTRARYMGVCVHAAYAQPERKRR